MNFLLSPTKSNCSKQYLEPLGHLSSGKVSFLVEMLQQLGYADDDDDKRNEAFDQLLLFLLASFCECFQLPGSHK
jgi:hypothetical protein